MSTLNGKVSHRHLGKAVADLTETVNHNANALNNQGRLLAAYGARLADALATIEQIEKRLASLQRGPVEITKCEGPGFLVKFDEEQPA